MIVQCECVREDRQEGRHEDRQGYRPDRRAGRGAGLASILGPCALASAPNTLQTRNTARFSCCCMPLPFAVDGSRQSIK